MKKMFLVLAVLLTVVVAVFATTKRSEVLKEYCVKTRCSKCNGKDKLFVTAKTQSEAEERAKKMHTVHNLLADGSSCPNEYQDNGWGITASTVKEEYCPL